MLRGTRFSRRLRNHGYCSIVSAVIAAAVFAAAPSKDPIARSSLSSAYAAFVLLTATLAIGPVNALRAARQPISSDVRRDVGLWAALWSLLHVVLGLQVHLRGRMAEYFFLAGDKPMPYRLRSDMFGFANYSGALATLLLVLLAVISNDWSLSRLGSKRWKNFQRLNYLLFAMVIIHGILYQVIEKRSPPFAFALGCCAAMAVTLMVARYVAERPSSRPLK